jgi:hypothetical protein
MKLKLTIILATALAVAGVSQRRDAAAALSVQTAAQKTGAKSSARAAPAPIAVEVVAVDPAAKTITVRDMAAVPAPPGKAVEVKLPVPATASGEKLGDVNVGDKVSVTCVVKPTVHPTAGVPVVLTDCLRVIKIEPK